MISHIERRALRAAIQALDAESRYIVDALFFSSNRKKESDLAKELGITQQGINRRKKKILKNLKILVVKSKKIQQ